MWLVGIVLLVYVLFVVGMVWDDLGGYLVVDLLLNVCIEVLEIF